MTFSATEAAFEGFRVTRRHPVAVLAWAGVMLAANIGSALAVGVLAGPAWGQFETLAATENPDPALLSQLMGKVLPAALISAVIQVVAAGVVNTSVLRALLRPRREAKLRLGLDEARVIWLTLMFVLVNFAAGLLLSAVLPRALGSIASLVVLAVLFIRFSLAGPMTIAEHRFRFKQSWRETRGRFLPLLGAEVMAAALAGVVAFLAHVVFVGVAGAVLIASGGNFLDLGTMFSPDFSSVDKLLTPLPLVYVAFLSVIYALVLVIMVGPPVELYRTLMGGVTDADPPDHS